MKKLKRIVIPESHFERKKCFNLFNELTGDNVMALEMQYHKPLALIEHEWLKEACKEDIANSEKNKKGIIIYVSEK